MFVGYSNISFSRCERNVEFINTEEWETFWSSFRTNVDVRDDLEKTTKFIYLVQSLEGEPKEMINGLAITDDNC